MSDVRWSRGRVAILGLALIAVLAILLGITASRRTRADTGGDNALQRIGPTEGPDCVDCAQNGQGGPGNKFGGKCGPGEAGGGGAPANPPAKTADAKTSAVPTGR